MALLSPNENFKSEPEKQAFLAARHLSENDPVMARLVERAGPFIIEPKKPYFFSLVSSIISQQISTVAAASILKRFMSLFPEVSAGGITSAQVLALTEDQLRGAGLSGQKARYLKDLAEKIETGQVDLANIEQFSDEEIIQQLTLVKGIGRWTVEMFLIFSLGRPDVLPVDDLGFQNGVHRLYGLPDRPSPKILKQFALEKGWSPYCSAATWYLWRSLALKDL